ncbi:MAG TPA: hypothetical protein VEK15_30700 [Vicinamibacteria bacterium]|nr:hypothetical protein [Vicinamibacteria bacterium]
MSPFGIVLVPAIITLAVTILRLVGELNGWSPALFDPEAGGGGAIVGIAWLVPIFGIYFAWKLYHSGNLSASYRTLGFGALGLAAFVVIAFGGSMLFGLDPNQVSLASLVVTILAALVGLGIAYAGSPVLGKTLVVYGLAARIPVILVMLLAILGNWGTHYDVVPPGFPEMGAFSKWFLIGVVPQLTIWMGYTVVLGAIFGGIALLVAERRRAAVRTA